MREHSLGSVGPESVIPESLEPDFSYITEKYPKAHSSQVWKDGLSAYNWHRSNLSPTENTAEHIEARVAPIAAELKILFSVDVIDEETKKLVADHLKSNITKYTGRGYYLQAAYLGALHETLFSDRFWDQETDYRMFTALETRIGQLQLETKGVSWGLNYRLTEPLMAQRILNGKTYYNTSWHVRRHIGALAHTASAINTPASARGFDHSYWPTDWEYGPQAAQYRILGALSISRGENGLVIID